MQGVDGGEYGATKKFYFSVRKISIVSKCRFLCSKKKSASLFEKKYYFSGTKFYSFEQKSNTEHHMESAMSAYGVLRLVGFLKL